MLSYFKKRWFLISLLFLISTGLTFGANSPEESITPVIGLVNPRLVTAIVLFLMSFSLDSRQLKKSFQSPGPVVWAAGVNYCLIPLMAWPLMFCQLTPDFAIGLMIAASVPCTMAAASVWTRKAGGNDSVSLLVTVITNGSCFFFTPFWLNLTTSSDVEFDFLKMAERLVYAVLLPTLVGQLLRIVPQLSALATKFKTVLGVVAQSCILTLVFGAACRGGLQLQGTSLGENLGAVALVWASCIFLHLLAMAIGYKGAGWLKFSSKDRVAIAFASSQKTLPIGILLATDPTMFGGAGVPFAVFPMLMYHASQLFIDTTIADRFAKMGDKSSTETAA